jgi:hypothetical protein
MTVDTTDNVCAVCRDTNVPCDYITRCGHSFHHSCLWAKFGSSNKECPCPCCRQTVSRVKEKERLLWGIKREQLDAKQAEEITKFLNVIIEDPQYNIYGYSSNPANQNIPSYGKEMIENLIKIGWHINSKAEGGLKLSKKMIFTD